MDIPRLHPDTIEAVKERADIYEVVSERVVLKRQGKDFAGLCPFHEEKSPSFNVIPSKQMYYCFGCGASGGAIKFLMEIGKRSFADAVLELARRYQVPVKTLEPEKHQELQRQITLRQQLYEIVAIAVSFYQHALRQQGGRHALEYLKSERRLSEETIQQFQLGYAPPGWETLHHYLVEVKRLPVQLVEKAGLIKQRKGGGGYIDLFRDRLIVPIHDSQGRAIAFGGRTLSDEQPKYLNSPETELFNKGKTLFALDKAKTAISKQDRAVVVEGYFDAIALHAAGIANAVASLGTALSVEQVRMLLRYTDSKQIVLNFDADKAGTNAAERAIGELTNLAYRGEVQLRILNLPDGKDADEYLKSYSSEEYQNLLNESPLWIDWQIQQLLTGKDLKQAGHYQQVAREMVTLLSRLEHKETRAHYVNRCAYFLSMGDSLLVPLRSHDLLQQINRPKFRRDETEAKETEKKKKEEEILPLPSERALLEQAEALLLRIYLHCPEYRQAVLDALSERNLQFSLSHHRFLWRQILEVEAPNMSASEIISKIQDRSLESSREIAEVSRLFYLDERTKQDILREPLTIRSAAACIERVICEKRYRHFMEMWRQTDCAANPELGGYYWEQSRAQKLRIQELDRQRFTSIFDLLQSAWVGN